MCCPDGQDCQGVYPEGVCHCSYDCHSHGDCCIDADISCQCRDGELRLVGGTEVYNGVLEVCFNNMWGYICTDTWFQPEATVACTQLGLPSAGT